MNGKQLILMMGAAVVLGGMALWLNRPAPRVGTEGVIRERVIPALVVNDVAGIVIQGAGVTTSVAQVDGIWRVKGRYNYPADFGRIRDLLNKLAELKVLRLLRTTPSERAELQLLTAADPVVKDASQKAAILELAGKDGKALMRLYMGMQHSLQTREEGMGGFPDSRFVMNEAGQVMLAGDPLQELVNPEQGWLDQEFINVNPLDIEEVQISGVTNGSVQAIKGTTGGELKLQGVIPEGKEGDEAKLNRLASALSYLRFEDVADPGLADTETGFDQPVTCQARTAKGEVYTVLLGKPVGALRYARVSVSFKAPASGIKASGPGTNQVDVIRKEAEINAATAARVKVLNDKVSPWIYLLNPMSVETLSLGFTDMIKEKPKPADAKAGNDSK